MIRMGVMMEYPVLEQRGIRNDFVNFTSTFSSWDKCKSTNRQEFSSQIF